MATIQRLTLYGFFDSLENDLIALIRSYSKLDESSVLLSKELRDKSKKILTKRGRDGVYNLEDDQDLLFGLDIGEKYSLLMKSKSQMDAATASYFGKLNNSFQKAIPIRNDVMHGRPLTAEDHSFTYAFVNELLTSAGRWKNLAKFHRLVTSNPNSVIAKNYEIFDAELVEETLHNLPVADYEDTGFVRRHSLEKELKKKILGRHPVVTVLGDGGNGKSALALQTAYNLAHTNDHDFDAIAWVTAKSSVLTVQEVKRIEGAITNSLAIFDAVADDFHEIGSDPQNRIEKLLYYNKVLLFIDNLETVLDERLKEFAENIPGKSKLVFTSRVPLGSDLSVVVTPFSDAEAITLFRRLVEAYAIEEFKQAPDAKIQKITQKLGNKPLLIKWFIRGISTGLTTQSILARKDVAVKFCLENVFDKLSEDGMKVARVYSVIPGKLSPNVVQKLSGLSATKVEAAIAELNRFAIISNSGSKAYEITYEMNQFAKRYLKISKNDDDDKAIQKERQKLVGAIQAERTRTKYNKYIMSSYTVRSDQEALSVIELKKAYRLSENGRVDEALDIIKEQRSLSGQFFEVYRTSAAIRARIDDLSGAKSDYEEAIDLEPSLAQLRFWFAGFLMRNLNDNEGAAAQYDKALDLDASNFLVFNDAIRNQFYLGDFEKARRLLLEAENLDPTERRHRTLLLDLKCQLILRQADQKLKSNGNLAQYLTDIEKLQEIIVGEQREYADEKLFHSIADVRYHFRTADADGIENSKITAFEKWFEEISGG